MANNDFFSHQARKRFGQNFLVDEGIIRQIIRAIRPTAKDHLVEIGPGQGALTHSLVDAAGKLDVVELDRDLIPMLKVQFDRHSNFSIHEADALKFDFTKLVAEHAQLRVVGNLPYNISTPLIFHLLSYQSLFADMHFMLQKEVVTRLAARPGDKLYGRLSVMAQYQCQIEAVFDVPPESFDPAPKVQSAIVRLIPYHTLPYVAQNEQHFAQVVKLAFQQRRKTLRNSLKEYLKDCDENAIPIDLSLRAERLSVEDFVNLSNVLLAE
jgi:16S rRNA (adenine1518-N6/adenine1519-N6)-dimethyltransferase